MSNPFLEAEVRQKIIEAIRKDLLGPSKTDEVLYGRPNVEYLTGILYPDFAERFDSSEETDFNIDNVMIENDEPIEEKNEKKLINTTSIGLSFYVAKNCPKIDVIASWGDYFSKKSEDAPDDLFEEEAQADSKKVKEKITYHRIPKEEKTSIDLTRISRTTTFDLNIDSCVKITVIKYDLKSDYSLVSVFLTNKRQQSNEIDSMMFQCKLNILCDNGFISESYARNNNIDDEYYYIEKPIFARGRGCAATWCFENNICRTIETEFIPEEEINKVSADFEEFNDMPGIFSTYKFSSIKNKQQIIANLRLFVSQYQIWINKLNENPKKKLFSSNMSNFHKIINECQTACDRMLNGINILENDDISFKAFCVMNQTIYLQNAIKRYAKKHAVNKCDFKDFINPDELKDFANSKNKFCWRPFQLAFILLNIKSIISPLDSERKIVDLLYFPTGGGKTEAYLGLIAFTIFNRRLRKNQNSEFNYDGGVTVMLRYTLRLLTTQQRDRLTKMILAAEYIRERNPQLYGEERISIGFWVGDSVVSNSFGSFIPGKTDEDEREAEKNKKRAAKQLPTCPFCGKPLNYYSLSDTSHGQNENSFVFDTYRQELRIYCLDEDCHYYKYPKIGQARSLPIYLIDEEIYNKCPTVILGTVDKFAKLPWDVRCNTLFGRVDRKCSRHGYIAIGDNHPNSHSAIDDYPRASTISVKKFLPPELIVQDELHLITGPLGTIYGGYETMIENLCSYNLNGGEVLPKYIVSTATIKNANEQIKSLYGRNHFQFPPSGLDSRDSYFIREVPLEKMPFRKYIGICANGQSMKTTLLRTFAISLQTVKNLIQNPRYSTAVDPYYTLVGYFNSIRELGGAARLIDDDIPKRIKRVCKLNSIKEQRFLPILNQKELTSRIQSEKIKEYLDLLEVECFNKDGTLNKKCIDTVIATNMIAVGMDVDRLGLMCVLGQPKQNSEYIQATSRIGRSHPGLVISLYNPYRPRDLSHYENFVAYHKQLYRYVEGTTATPFAARARDRFLHAIIISAFRLKYKKVSQNPKRIIDLTQNEIDEIVHIILNRINIVDQAAILDAKHDIKCFIEEWKREVVAGNEVIYTGSYSPDKTRLMVSYSDKHKSSEKGTLQSMREVDNNSGLYLYEEEV